MPEHCPLCKQSGSKPGIGISGTTTFDCNRCGSFTITRRAKSFLRHYYDDNQESTQEFAKNLTSHSIRRMQFSGQTVVIDEEFVEHLLEHRSLPSPFEQANYLLVFLGNKHRDPSENIRIHISELQSIIGASSAPGVNYVVNYLESRASIKWKYADNDVLAIGLTFQGWSEYERLQRQTVESRTAFMAMQYGNEELNSIVLELRKGVEETGFDLRILTDTPKAGLIDDRMRVEIRNSRFLIADITHRNPGAYWEAGFAEGLGKPVIYICKESVFKDVSHFDTNHHLTVMWNSSNPSQATEDLKNTIRATLPDEAKMID